MLWIVHYSEIGLKKKNRDYFERKLLENIKIQTKAKVERKRGRILVYGENLEDKLAKIPGIEYFCKVIDIFKKPEELVEKFNINFSSISIVVKRADKDWPENSLEIKNKLIKLILQKYPEIKIDFEKPEKTLFLEYFNKNFYFYLDKIKGVGGLPVGTGGKALSLISCGFDSPVASFLMIKRGVNVDFVHFYAYPQTSILEKEAVFEIFKILSQYQPKSKIFFINILEAQKYILSNVPPKYLVIFYRRFMLDIAKELANQYGYNAIITGENLGQVSSQTIENIWSISFDSNILILRPLLGFNKQEIIDLSYKIGTGKISEKNYADCCNLYISKFPATKTKIEEIIKIQEKLSLWEKFKKECIENMEIYHWPGK